MNHSYFGNHKKQLIIFFSGWGMEDIACRDLDLSEYDLLCLYDYRSLELPAEAIKIISGYDKKHLICWSMGILAAEQVHSSLKNLVSRIALCGSPFAISNDHGIPPRIFNKTFQKFSAEFMTGFLTNMGLKTDSLNELNFQDSLEVKKDELQILSSYQPVSNIDFDLAVIASQDRVFPYDNLLNYWQKTNTKTITLECGHYLFALFHSWQEIMDLIDDK
jgi:hypothetical protein